MGVIRLLLALAVVISHASGGVLFAGCRPLITGPNSVEAFYVLSGFYMALVLETKYGRGAGGVRVFWQNRYLRLAPTYWIVLAITFLVAVTTERDGELLTKLATLGAGSIALVAITNVAILGQDAMMFLGCNPEQGERSFHFVSRLFGGSTLPAWHFLLVPQAWTLGVELLFYLCVPLLARLRSATLALVLAASVALRFAIYSHGYHFDPWTFRFFPNELAFFVAGMLSYRLHRRYPWADLSAATRWLVFAGLVVLALAAGSERVAIGFFVALPLMLPAVFELTRRAAWDARLAELSYPVYVVHWLVMPLSKHFGAAKPLAACAISLMCALALVHAVERPVDRYRQRRLRAAKASGEPAR